MPDLAAISPLSILQRKFPLLVSKLIAWAYARGYELTFGETYRTPEQAALNAKNGIGIANSLHTKRLAIDLNLFIDGQLQKFSEAYKPLGDYWLSLDPDCAWGGTFKNKDGGHFSLSYNGIK